jgi:hypothetical protein
MNRQPVVPASSIPIAVRISSLFMPGISNQIGKLPPRSLVPWKLYTSFDDVQMKRRLFRGTLVLPFCYPTAYFRVTLVVRQFTPR